MELSGTGAAVLAAFAALVLLALGVLKKWR
jgi:hypothetical protein